MNTTKSRITGHPGFTLLELLVTLAVIAIVVAFAVPSFNSMILDNRITSAINEVSSLISFARSEASKRPGGYVTLCPTSDNTSCNGTDAWGDGWLIMLDTDGDRTLDASDQVLRVVGELGDGLSLDIDGFTGGGLFVQFDGRGQPAAAGTLGASAGTFVVCDGRGDSAARGIVVMVSGQLRAARDEGTDGIVDKHDGGGNISCS